MTDKLNKWLKEKAFSRIFLLIVQFFGYSAFLFVRVWLHMLLALIVSNLFFFCASGDVLRHCVADIFFMYTHGLNEIKKGLRLETKKHRITNNEDSVCLSIFVLTLMHPHRTVCFQSKHCLRY